MNMLVSKQLCCIHVEDKLEKLMDKYLDFKCLQLDHLCWLVQYVFGIAEAFSACFVVKYKDLQDVCVDMIII